VEADGNSLGLIVAGEPKLHLAGPGEHFPGRSPRLYRCRVVPMATRTRYFLG
jgi:hypothetical protein